MRGGERGGDVDDAHPEVIADQPDLQAAGVGEAPPQRFVDRTIGGAHGAHEVDAEEVGPHRRLGVGVGGLHLEDPQVVAGHPVGTVVREGVAGERVGRPSGSVVHRGEEARTAGWRA